MKDLLDYVLFCKNRVFPIVIFFVVAVDRVCTVGTDGFSHFFPFLPSSAMTLHLRYGLLQCVFLTRVVSSPPVLEVACCFCAGP